MTMPRLVLLAAALVALVVSACSGPSSDDPSASVPVTTPSSGLASSGAEPSTVATTPAPSVDTSLEDAWEANATQHRGMNGEQFEYDCPAGGVADTVWGTDVYTDDSSVCTAAVHVGAITIDEGGTVTIEIRPGEDSYEESERNGITTQPYPAWGGSFVIVDD